MSSMKLSKKILLWSRDCGGGFSLRTHHSEILSIEHLAAVGTGLAVLHPLFQAVFVEEVAADRYFSKSDSDYEFISTDRAAGCSTIFYILMLYLFDSSFEKTLGFM